MSVNIEKRFYNIEELSVILGKSISGIHGHLARKQFDAVPPPMKLGRRLAWLSCLVDDWINDKANIAAAEVAKHKEYMQAPAKHRGRSSKAEIKARDRAFPEA
jgi:predicted DNA-binding transcriptional regulator AlpA